MDITWLGTAGFKIETGPSTLLVDPYLTRNPKASPRQPKSPEDFKKTDHIFISHGHFDHVLDIPEIASISGARIFGSQKVLQSLKEAQGLGPLLNPVAHGQIFDLGRFKAQSFFSAHVRFDLKLMLSTLARIHVRLISCARLLAGYPCGQVVAWRFFIEGKSILFFGSAGAKERELESLCRTPTDILLLPLQGHTRICDIAVKMVRILDPAVVIPHHFDNFYPPISQSIDIEPFIEKTRAVCPKKINIIVPKINTPIRI